MNWQLVGTIGVSDDDGELQVLGATERGEPVKQANIAVAIKRFRGNEVTAAYNSARELIEKELARIEAEAKEETPDGAGD